MKNKIKILAGILAIYLLSLPVILIFHSQTHLRDTVKIVKSDFDDITTQVSSDCQICSFYFNQQLYIQNTFVYELDTLNYYSHQNIVDVLIDVSPEEYYLRGPPVA